MVASATASNIPIPVNRNVIWDKLNNLVKDKKKQYATKPETKKQEVPETKCDDTTPANEETKCDPQTICDTPDNQEDNTITNSDTESAKSKTNQTSEMPKTNEALNHGASYIENIKNHSSEPKSVATELQNINSPIKGRSRRRDDLNARLLALLDSAKTGINSIGGSKTGGVRKVSFQEDKKPLLQRTPSSGSSHASNDNDQQNSESEDSDSENEGDKEEKEKGDGYFKTETRRYIAGIIICLLFTMCDTMTKTFAQLLNGTVSSMQMNIAIFTTLIVIMTPYMIWTKTIVPKSKMGFFIATTIGLTKCVNYAFGNLAVLYVPVGTATTEMNAVFLLGVLAYTCAFGGKSVSRSSLIIDTASVFLIIAGVVMVIQPPALFPNTKVPKGNLTVICSKGGTAESQNNADVNVTIDLIPSDTNALAFEDNEPKAKAKNDRPMWKGHCYMILFGITSTATVVLLSKSSKHMSTAETIYWSAVTANIVSIALFLPHCKSTFYIPEGTLCLCIWLLHAFCGGVTGLFGNTAVILLPTTDFAVVSALSLANLFILQFTLLRNIKPAPVNFVAILGAVLICMVCFGKPVLRNLYQNNEDANEKEKEVETIEERKALIKRRARSITESESPLDGCMCYL